MQGGSSTLTAKEPREAPRVRHGSIVPEADLSGGLDDLESNLRIEPAS